MRKLCPACDSAGSRSAWSIRGLRFRRCRGCGTLWVENPHGAGELNSLYGGRSSFENPSFGRESGYRGYIPYLADRSEIEAKFAGVLAHLEAQISPGRLLDLGAG